MKITMKDAQRIAAQILAAWWREAATVALSAWGVFEVASSMQRSLTYDGAVSWEWSPSGLSLGVGLLVSAVMVRPTRCSGNCRSFRGKL